MSHAAIQIATLECWHANHIMYQAEGTTHDGRFVYARYRRPWFSLGVGFTPDEAVGNDVFTSDAHPDHDPSSITLATLKAWTDGASPEIAWPDHVHGFHNEDGPLS